MSALFHRQEPLDRVRQIVQILFPGQPTDVADHKCIGWNTQVGTDTSAVSGCKRCDVDAGGYRYYRRRDPMIDQEPSTSPASSNHPTAPIDKHKKTKERP